MSTSHLEDIVSNGGLVGFWLCYVSQSVRDKHLTDLLNREVNNSWVCLLYVIIFIVFWFRLIFFYCYDVWSYAGSTLYVKGPMTIAEYSRDVYCDSYLKLFYANI